MAEKQKTPSPPYATFSAFLNFINKLRDTQVPSRIDPTVFGNASGSLSYSIIAALKSLKLISADGKPAAELVSFVKASDDDRKALMQAILREGYPSLWTDAIDLGTATAGQFDEHIRSEYDVKGSTVDKVANFFIAAAKYADFALSHHLSNRKPTAPSSSAAKSKKQRRPEELGGNGHQGGNDAPPLPPPPISEKALEYRLVDLMAEAMGDPDVLQAIIKVVTFLKAKDAARTNAATGQ